jgi:hypothetical protein
VTTREINVQRFAPYGDPEALKVARDLDTKIESLLLRPLRKSAAPRCTFSLHEALKCSPSFADLGKARL